MLGLEQLEGNSGCLTKTVGYANYTSFLEDHLAILTILIMLLLDLVTNQRLLLLKKVMLTDMRGCRPGEENNRNTTLNTRSKGRNAEENIAKGTQEAQQIPGEVPNYVSLVQSQAITVMLQIIVLGLPGVEIM